METDIRIKFLENEYVKLEEKFDKLDSLIRGNGDAGMRSKLDYVYNEQKASKATRVWLFRLLATGLVLQIMVLLGISPL